MFYEEYLEKLAAKRKDAFNTNFGEQSNKERKLIQDYKSAIMPFEKNMIFNDIKKEYANIVNSCINSSGILGIMDRSDAQTTAEIALKHIIDKFDLTYKNKPSTFVIGRLDNELKREIYNNQNNISRRSSENTMKNGYMIPAEQMFKKINNRIPTVDELHHYITNVMDKKIEKSDIERNLSMNRNILSGDQVMGTNADSNAEVMTLMDVKDVSKQTAAQLMDSQVKQEKLENILNSNFVRPERKMIRKYYGWGEFKGKAENLNRSATECGISYYDAKLCIAKFEKILDQKSLLKDEEF